MFGSTAVPAAAVENSPSAPPERVIFTPSRLAPAGSFTDTRTVVVRTGAGAALAPRPAAGGAAPRPAVWAMRAPCDARKATNPAITSRFMPIPCRRGRQQRTCARGMAELPDIRRVSPAYVTEVTPGV